MPSRKPGPARVIDLGDGVELKTARGFRGKAAALKPASGAALRRRAAARRRGTATRLGAAPAVSTLESALAENGAHVVKTFRIEPPAPQHGRALRAARTLTRIGDIEFETAEDEAAVLMRENPDGTVTWLYPEQASAASRGRALRRRAPGAAATPGRRRWSCRIDAPRPYAPPTPVRKGRSAGRRRALIGLIAAAIVKVVVFKVVSWVASELLQHLVRRHEERRMEEGFKKLKAGGFAAPGEPAMKASDWPALSGRRALVFIHGTFSDALGAFGKLDESTLDALRDRYPGGVYSFDHFSLSKSPMENAHMFFDQLPLDEGGLQLDLVSHSRGGLVARCITELNENENVTFGNVVFFGTPNAGTPLADPKRLKECLGLMTNLVKLMPAFALTFALSWIVAAVQWIAANGVGKLPGLMAQNPSSPFLETLNAPVTDTNASYAAVTANYEADGGLLNKLKDAGMDALFAADNDLVVPTESVLEVDQSASQPVLVAGRILRFDGGKVFHGNFFEQPSARKFLLQVLG